MRPYRSREILSWCLYDFANSSYSAVIASVIFPVYFVSHIVGNEKGLGDMWWGRAISLSMLIVLLSSPIVGLISDLKGWHRAFLRAYTLLCVVSVSLLSLIGQGEVTKGVILIILANTAMEGGLVFYNAFMPYIVGPEYFGRLSAWGFAMGYLGSVSSLLISIPFVSSKRYDLLWLMVSFFYLFFSIPCLLNMPSNKKQVSEFENVRSINYGKENIKTFLAIFRKMFQIREIRRFLVAYFVYEDAVNTVIIFSAIFAASTLGFGYNELVGLYLLVQLSAFIGSMLSAKPLDTLGPKKVISFTLVIWILVCLACFFVVEKLHFWALACFAGFGLGTIQAGSRSMFLRLIERGREGESFGVYSLVGKSSAILGPLVFGEVSALFQSQRPAIAVVGILFSLGLLLIWRVRA